MAEVRPQTGLEIKLKLTSGQELYALSWGDPVHQNKVLAVHGLSENAASFSFVAPLLASRGFHVVAADLPGHGRSKWRADGVYSCFAIAHDLRRTLDALGWRTCTCLAHSIGTAYAIVLAGSFPDRIVRYIGLEGFGGFGLSYGLHAQGMLLSADLPKAFRRSSEGIAAVERKKRSKKFVDLHSAAKYMIRPAEHFGSKPMKLQSALVLAARGTTTIGAGATSVLEEKDSGLVFTHDTRAASGAGFQLLSEKQVLSFMQKMPPSLILVAEHGLPDAARSIRKYVSALQFEEERPITVVDVPGAGHHLHLDEPERTAWIILDWLDNRIHATAGGSKL